MNVSVHHQEKNERLRAFSFRLKEAMDAGDFNNSQLAKAISSTHTTVGRWLKGAQPGIDDLNKIARVLNVSVQWLLNGEGEIPPVSHPSAVAKDVGAFDEEKQVIDEIAVRIEQFKHAERKRRDLYSQQIMNRVQEYNDWCETFAKPVRDSQLPHVRKQIESEPPTTNKETPPE
jgi:transcriptional regulator with XRE-family HTH domain